MPRTDGLALPRARPLGGWIWIAYLALGGLAAALYLLPSPLQGNGLLFSAISASSSVAILAAIHIHRPVAAWVWRWFAIGQALFFLGDAYTYGYPVLIGHGVPFPSPGDFAYLLVYPALMTGVLLAARRRNPQGDRTGVIDALIITVAMALLSWGLLISPYVHDTALSPFAKSVSIAYPLGDVLLLAAALRLAFDGGTRNRSFYLLAGSITAVLVTDATYGDALLAGTFHHQLIYDAGWLLYYLLWGAAALHPSMRAFGEATPDRERRLSPQRLAALTAAALVAPAIEFVREAREGDYDLLLIVGASIVVFLLVVVRVLGLVKQNERTVVRERALRLSNLALVRATTPDEIDAVTLRTAQALVEGSGEARLCVQRPGGLVPVRAAPGAGDALGAGTLALLEGAATRSGERIALTTAAEDVLDLPAGQQANVFRLATRENRRGLLIVAAATPLSPIVIEAIGALCASVSLALESVALIDLALRRENEARLESLVRNASDLITVVDRTGEVLYQSPSIERILGRGVDSVSGSQFAQLLVPADRDRLRALLETTRGGASGSHAFECTLNHSDGRTLEFEFIATDLCDDEHVRGIVLNGRDASERRAFEEQLAHQAFHDVVTGLPNRALFANRVEHALTIALRESTSLAVILLGLDDFKTINNSLGQAAGDEVLRQVAGRVLETVRPSDTTARLGGDEFAVLVEDVGDPVTAVGLAELLVRAFERPISVLGTDLPVRPSIGIAVRPAGAEAVQGEAADLVRDADAAMYMCKRDARGGYRIFESAMHELVLERLWLRAELELAIAAGQFELHFQPVVRLGDATTSGIEALVRWHHPTRGFVQPGQFIPLAEDMGLIVELGRWVLREACRCCAEMCAAGEVGDDFSIGVNLSVKQLQDPDVVDDVRAALEATGLVPGMLVLEVTESAVIVDHKLAARHLRELKALGVRIALDDFGTGYSSLSYLGRLPVDVLKIDQSFLAAGEIPQPSGLMAGIVALGRSLGLRVVAEGIELPEQYTALRDLGCDLGQGYLIARPMNLAATREWLVDAAGAAHRAAA